MTQYTLQAIRHVGFEDLGSFEAPLRAAGYQIEYIDAAERDLSQLDPLAADLLVVLGGPIGVYDHDRYPLVTAELELLRARLAADRPTLGICLGAQLMAAALGSSVYPGPSKEIGWSTLELATSDNQPLAALRDVAVLHWHGDTFDLPEGCTLLASTPLCRQQAFARGQNVLGLNFTRKCAATVSSIGCWATPANWPAQVSTPSPCVMTPSVTPMGLSKQAPHYSVTGWPG